MGRSGIGLDSTWTWPDSSEW